MARDWREEYNGGIYHVIARGNNKEYIFKESIVRVIILLVPYVPMIKTAK